VKLEGGELKSVARVGFPPQNICSNAAIQGSKRYPTVTNSATYEAYDRVVKSCIEARKWEGIKCSVFATNKKSAFDYTNTVDTTTIFDTLSYLGRGVSNVIESVQGHSYQRKLISSRITDRIVGLNSCQQACLLKCATSKILIYPDKVSEVYTVGIISTIWGSSSCLIRDGRGVCKDFSSLSNSLGEDTLIPSVSAASGSHAYNKYKINGEWYIGEPQNASCVFYHTPKTLLLYENAAQGEDNVHHGGRGFIRKFDIGGPGSSSRPKAAGGM